MIVADAEAAMLEDAPELCKETFLPELCGFDFNADRHCLEMTLSRRRAK